jgi:hypothetical protein
MAALQSQFMPKRQERRCELTRIESNRLFSFIASYTFSGTNASLRGSFGREASERGVEVPEADALGRGWGMGTPVCVSNSRKKMILTRQFKLESGCPFQLT